MSMSSTCGKTTGLSRGHVHEDATPDGLMLFALGAIGAKILGVGCVPECSDHLDPSCGALRLDDCFRRVGFLDNLEVGPMPRVERFQE